MAHTFLSEDWFAKLAELTEAAGDLNVPEQLQGFVLNITITEKAEGDALLCLNSGNLQAGHQDEPSASISLPESLALRLFVENDQSAGMEGFMSGQIKVDGDVGSLMAMQAVQPSEEQQALQKQILEMTQS